jgi:hypothetical protein
MHHDNRHRGGSMWLPIALAQNRYTRLNLDQTPLRRPQFEFSPVKKSCEGLHVSAAQKSSRPELQLLTFNVLVSLLHYADSKSVIHYSFVQGTLRATLYRKLSI